MGSPAAAYLRRLERTWLQFREFFIVKPLRSPRKTLPNEGRGVPEAPGLPFPQGAVGFGGAHGGPRATVAPPGPRRADRDRRRPEAAVPGPGADRGSHQLGAGAAAPPTSPGLWLAFLSLIHSFQPHTDQSPPPSPSGVGVARCGSGHPFPTSEGLRRGARGGLKSKPQGVGGGWLPLPLGSRGRR